MKDVFLVSIGAAFGANMRFILYKKLEKLKIANYVAILIINNFSSFLLGFFLSAVPQIRYFNFSFELVLFFSIGFLGSLSTFSSFIHNLFDLFIKFKFFRALKLLIISIASGIVSLAFGLFLSNQYSG
ncbi:CrcB family protein [Prochlorococcus marinus]|uniref:fluoride efflux transporter FluC n=1 Tax=Prochlorococcus marinus TaxID=1219 RepID=UPI002FBE3899